MRRLLTWKRLGRAIVIAAAASTIPWTVRAYLGSSGEPGLRALPGPTTMAYWFWGAYVLPVAALVLAGRSPGRCEGRTFLFLAAAMYTTTAVCGLVGAALIPHYRAEGPHEVYALMVFGGTVVIASFMAADFLRYSTGVRPHIGSFVGVAIVTTLLVPALVALDASIAWPLPMRTEAILYARRDALMTEHVQHASARLRSAEEFRVYAAELGLERAEPSDVDLENFPLERPDWWMPKTASEVWWNPRRTSTDEGSGNASWALAIWDGERVWASKGWSR